MHKKLFPFLGLIAALATVSFAQTTNYPTPTAVKLSLSADSFDPLGILETEHEPDDKKASGVKSSVVVNLASLEQSTFDLINRKRVEYGLLPLIWSEDVAAVARIHSKNMAEFNFFSHRGLDSKLVSDRADSANVGRWRAIGENIAFNRGYKDPTEKAVELWLDSPTHRRNMMDAGWKESAVGVAIAVDGSYYFTQVFLTRR